MSDVRQKERLEQLLNLENFNETEKIKSVTNIYNELNIKDYTIETIHKYFNNAKNIIQNLNLPPNRKQPLWDFASQLVNRNY